MDNAMTAVAALRVKADAAIANNATYLAIVGPTAAQAIAQVERLTRQVNAIIRQLTDQLDDLTGT